MLFNAQNKRLAILTIRMMIILMKKEEEEITAAKDKVKVNEAEH